MRAAPTIGVLVLLAGATISVVAEEKETSMSVDRLTPRTGTWWFSMESNGKPVGYAHLVATAREGGGVAYAWKLELAFPGQTYSEARTLVMDAAWRVVSASFSVGGPTLVEGKREGDRIVGVARDGKTREPSPLDVEVPDDATTGMGFVLAACMPREPGLALIRTELNVPRGFERLGTTVMRCREEETIDGEGGPVETMRFEQTDHAGKVQKLWVDAEGRLRRADWGGGMMMNWSAKSTKHLFKPAPAAVSEVPAGPEKLVVRGEFPHQTPDAMFELWTRSEKIVTWWPPEADVEPKVGGKFHLSWPTPQWFLRGKITVYEPGKRLGFTWKWHHEKPDAPAREVVVEFAAREAGGTTLTITMGPYGKGPAEEKEREGHLGGWKHFCTKLAALR